MYDSITLDAIPADTPAVAGYVNGHWPTYNETVRRWPGAKHLSIAVTANADAECLDVETGDATIGQAAAWVKRQQARGVWRPVVYTSLSNAAALLASLNASGISRSDIRLWTAHYCVPRKEHLCSPSCGAGMPTTADATQWDDRAQSRNLDQSITADGFWAPDQPPAPVVGPVTEDNDMHRIEASIPTSDPQGNGFVYLDQDLHLGPLAGRVISVAMNGNDPATDGGYPPIPRFAWSDRNADVLVEFSGSRPASGFDIVVWVTG